MAGAEQTLAIVVLKNALNIAKTATTRKVSPV